MDDDLSASDTAARLRVAIGRLYRTFRRDGQSELSTSLSTTTLQIMMAINRSGPLNLGELAGVLGVPPSNLTRAVAGLADSGLIARSVPDDDRRAVVVAVSAKGSDLVHRVEAEKAHVLAQRLASLQPQQRRAVRDVIPVLVELLVDSDEEVDRRGASGAPIHARERGRPA